MYVCMYVCIYVRSKSVCLYPTTAAHADICVYVCMYIYIYTYIHTYEYLHTWQSTIRVWAFIFGVGSLGFRDAVNPKPKSHERSTFKVVLRASWLYVFG